MKKGTKKRAFLDNEHSKVTVAMVAQKEMMIRVSVMNLMSIQ